MAKARLTYLERRGAVYYARIDVPTDLVAHYGTSTKKKSLRTKEEAVAKVRLWPVIEAWRLEFEDVRSRRAITEDDKADAVWRHYSDALERDEERRKRLPGEAEINAATLEMLARARAAKLDIKDPLAVLSARIEVDALTQAGEFDTRARKAKLDDLRKHLVKGETALIAHEVDAYAEANGLIIERGSDDWNDLARKMMRADIEVLERTFERDRGDYGGVPKDPIVKPVVGTAREKAKAGETIMELFEVYAAENPRSISTDTLNQARRDIGTFVEMVGRTFPAHRLDKKAVREWKALLIRAPVKWTETKAFAGMTMAQAVQANTKVGKPILTPRTVNRYLSSLGAFSNWLVSHGYVDVNPVDGMSLAKKKEHSTFPFTPDQLTTLFNSPLFTGCLSGDEWRFLPKPGNVLVRDHRYWVPLIMLYSGARPGEIAQLATSDVRQEHGVWIMHITTEGDGKKSVKTAGSMRVLPIHSTLIRLGLLDHHARMVKEGQKQLFPEAARNSRGQMIAEFSREFGRYLERLGMKEGRGLSLYSFRHGATDAFRRAGYLDQQFDFLLGHTKATMTGRYGILPQGDLNRRVELIEAIAYPGLALDHLNPPK